jgi:DNA-binding PadR family transcriptional regulator
MDSPSRDAPLSPAVFHILLALTPKERHGYAIMREVAEVTNDQFTMGPGTLYGTLKRMLEAGLVAEAGERLDPALGDERRRYYRITEKGSLAAVGEAQRLELLTRLARSKSLLKEQAR